jgi:hypothetical protein
LDKTKDRWGVRLNGGGGDGIKKDSKIKRRRL